MEKEIEKIDTGLVCCFYMLQYYNISFNPDTIVHSFKTEESFNKENLFWH